MARARLNFFCVVLAAAQVGAHGAFQFPEVNKQPFVSVVAVDLLWSLLDEAPGNVSHVQEMLHDACSRGFTFIRLAGSAFWPSQMNLYNSNSSAYWAVFDTVVAIAKANGCGLVPSLFWNTFLFPDLFHEPLGALSQPATSAAYAAMETYTTALVQRYSADPTIVAWEIGNEWNLLMDINMTGQTYCCAPSMGTPAMRTSADNISTDGLMLAMTGLADAIRVADPLHRPVTSGHGLPRPQAEHLRASYYSKHQDWGADTVEQFNTNVRDINAPCDWVSGHIYAGTDNERWNITDPNSPEMLAYLSAAAELVDKPVYVGEFGDPDPGERPFTRAMLALLGQLGTPRATVWVWEFYQNGINLPPAAYSLIPGRDDAIISALQAYNQLM